MSLESTGAIESEVRKQISETRLLEDGPPIGQLALFLVRLLETNERMNLVSARSAEPRIITREHLLDSLLGLSLLPNARAGKPLWLLDLGSGGGFPAIPLLIVRRDISAVLVESTTKKARFLEEIIRELGLSAEVRTTRFPERLQTWTERFDVLTTRAVAGAGLLVRRARPVLAEGARALLWTTETLFEKAVEESGAKKGRFVKSPAALHRGIGILEELQ